MTVALLLAAAPDRLSAMAHPYQRAGDGPAIGAPWLDFMGDRLMSAGVRQVDVAMCTDAADGLRAVAAIARGTGEPVLVCTSSRALATPRDDLAALLGGTGTAALAADGALLVASKDLRAVAEAAEALAARIASGQQPGRGRRVSLRRVIRRTRVGSDLDSAVDSLIECVSGNGVRVVALDGSGVALSPYSGNGTGNGDGTRNGAPFAQDNGNRNGHRSAAAPNTAPGDPARASGGQAGTSGSPARPSGSPARPSGGQAETPGSSARPSGSPAGIPGSPARPSGSPARPPGGATPTSGGPAWAPGKQARGRARSAASSPEPGLVAGLAVDPVASRMARWGPVRGLAPDAFTIAAFALSLCAAAWFASGSRSSLLAGSALICVALPVRQARCWLAASSRAAAGFGSWLTAVTGAAGEFAVYAGLAVGWAGVSMRHAWGYATAAMIVLAVRQVTDGCYAAVAGPRPETARTGHWLLRLTGQSIALPTGERTLLVAVTAAVWGPRIALTALIGWGAIAVGYVLAERSVAGPREAQPGEPARTQPGQPPRTQAGQPPRSQAAPAEELSRALLLCRDDGPLASRIGAVVQGQLPPLLPAIAGITVTAMLAALGLHNMPGALLLAPAVAMLLAALGSHSPHTGRFDWLVPPLLQSGEYVYLTAVAFAANVPAPATYVLIAAIALHHIDVLYRERYDIAPSARATAAGLGWEGRMLVAGFGGMLGIETFVCIALAGYLWVLFGRDSLTDWAALTGAARSGATRPRLSPYAPHRRSG